MIGNNSRNIGPKHYRKSKTVKNANNTDYDVVPIRLLYMSKCILKIQTQQKQKRQRHKIIKQRQFIHILHKPRQRYKHFFD